MPYNKIPIWKNKSLKSLRGEIWKHIPGYPTYYMVSSIGRVKSSARKNCIIKSQWPDKDGYLKVGMVKDGNPPTPTSVHRLVGLAFIKNKKNKPEINHLFGDKKDNSVDKLKWATESENQIHARDIGLNSTRGQTHHKAILNNKQVLQIYKSDKSCIELSREYNVDFTTISTIKTGKNWSSVTNKKYKKVKFNRICSEKDAKYIFSSKEPGVFLAKKFNVSTCTISEIRTGRTWSHVTGKKYSK